MPPFLVQGHVGLGVAANLAAHEGNASIRVFPTASCARRVAAAAVRKSQVLEIHELVLRRAARHRGGKSGGEGRSPKNADFKTLSFSGFLFRAAF
jgi:hypothetical protein